MKAQEKDSVGLKPEFGMELTSELQFTHTGQFNFANLLRLSANVPLSRRLALEASSISAYMTSEESIGDDIQTFSNIDAETVPFALSVFGLNWNIDDRNSLFFGIRNMNEDYFASDVTSLYTNSSCGIFPTIAGNYPIANYPVASVGMHYRYESDNGQRTADNGRFALQASIYNGTGYNHFTGRESVFLFCPKSDGIFGLAQAEYQYKGSSYFLGACGHYGDIFEIGKRELGTTIWTYAEQRVTDNLYLIAGYSHAFTSESLCSDFVGLGGKYSWAKCELGLFTDYAHFVFGGESATELTCKVQLTPHVYLQPTTHFIFTDGDFLSVAMLRMGVAF